MNTENNKIAIICITQNGKNLALKLSNNLSKESLGNENEIYKLYELIEN